MAKSARVIVKPKWGKKLRVIIRYEKMKERRPI